MSTTKTTTANAALEAERLAAQAAEAIAKADAARERAEEAGRRAEAERQAELVAIRRQRLASYDHAAMAADERAALQRFRDEITAGRPGLLEYVAWKAAVSTHYVVATEAATIQATLHPERSPMPTPGVAGGTYADAVQKILDSLVSNLVADFEDARQAELDAAGR